MNVLPSLISLVLAMLLSGAPGVANAQPSASPTLVVQVRAQGQPVPGATVRTGIEKAVTNAKGEAGLSLKAGEHGLTIEAPGFVPAAAVATVQADGRVSITVDLEPLEEEVLVSATRSGTRLEDQPLRVEVVGREEIEEKALMTPGSVAMLLGETTGLRVQVTAPSMGASNVRIQGLRGHYSQLLADGLPLYGAQGDSFSLLQVPPLDLGQVTREPATSAWRRTTSGDSRSKTIPH